MRLSAYETHKMIKAHIPDASTVYEREQEAKQYTFPFMHNTQYKKFNNWAMTHRDLKAIDPDIYNAYKANIERSIA